MNYFEHDNDDAVPADRFGDALALIAAAMNAREVRKKVLHLKKLESDVAAASEALARLQEQRSGIIATAQKEAEQIRQKAHEEREGVAAEREQLDRRAAHIARLEEGWRFVGEDEQVRRGFRSPEASPLAKARAAHGLPLIAEPDPLGMPSEAAEALTLEQFEKLDPDYRARIGTE
jgi:hypothetical protein